MYSRIYSFLCKNKLLNANQFVGFPSNCSTEQINLIETVIKHLDNGEIICDVFVDLQKAFDTGNYKILLEQLNHFGKRSKYS